jgi:lipid-A-disaccharide synthase
LLDKTKTGKILIVTGEASGDLHASHLVTAMRACTQNLEFYGMGGEKLRAAGTRIVFDIAQLSVMGITEVVRHLGKLYRVFSSLKASLKNDRPDLLILVDYPDFNLRLAKAAKKYSIPVLYYISPQIWAWRTSRLKQIGTLVTKMIVVFPFELPLYERAGIDASFVGHPLLDILHVTRPKEESTRRFGLDERKTTIGLLPGSRLSEVKKLLPPMIEAARHLTEHFSNLQFIVPIAPGLERKEIEHLLERATVPITAVSDSIYEVIDSSYLVIVASGTATLETALLATPMVIVYKMSPLSYLIGKTLIKVPYIGMANIIAGKKIVPELIQGEATAGNIAAEVTRMLTDIPYYQNIGAELAAIKEKLGEPGASKRAAQIAVNMLSP